jgi:hypothetical protein
MFEDIWEFIKTIAKLILIIIVILLVFVALKTIIFDVLLAPFKNF